MGAIILGKCFALNPTFSSEEKGLTSSPLKERIEVRVKCAW